MIFHDDNRYITERFGSCVVWQKIELSDKMHPSCSRPSHWMVSKKRPERRDFTELIPSLGNSFNDQIKQVCGKKLISAQILELSGARISHVQPSRLSPKTLSASFLDLGKKGSQHRLKIKLRGLVLP